MVDWRKVFSLIPSWDHCQRSAPSRISDMPWAGFRPAQNLSLGFVEWSYAEVITTADFLWIKNSKILKILLKMRLQSQVKISSRWAIYACLYVSGAYPDRLGDRHANLGTYTRNDLEDKNANRREKQWDKKTTK